MGELMMHQQQKETEFFIRNAQLKLYNMGNI